jgi:hypothetical protein
MQKTGRLALYDLQGDAVDRLTILMEHYHDRPMDRAAASLIVAAERLGIRRWTATAPLTAWPLVLHPWKPLVRRRWQHHHALAAPRLGPAPALHTAERHHAGAARRRCRGSQERIHALPESPGRGQITDGHGGHKHGTPHRLSMSAMRAVRLPEAMCAMKT